MTACLHQVHPIRTMSEVLLLHDSAWLHTSVHTTLTITNFEWTVLPPLPYSPDLTPPYYHLYHPLNKSLQEHNHANDKALQNAVRLWLQRRDTNF